MPTEHFRSKEAYRKSRAYTHIHGIPTHATDVVVAGKRHKVKHSKMEHEEKKETPEMEAKHHSGKFLKKAAKLSGRKIGKGKKSRKAKSEKKAARKRV